MHKPINPHQPITLLFKKIEDAQILPLRKTSHSHKRNSSRFPKQWSLGTGQYNQAYRVCIALPEAQKKFLNPKQQFTAD